MVTSALLLALQKAWVYQYIPDDASDRNARKGWFFQLCYQVIQKEDDWERSSDLLIIVSVDKEQR